MNLLILGAPLARERVRPNYRGTYREKPRYCESESSHHEINQLFFWYIEPFGGGPVSDLTKAMRYIDMCKSYFPDDHFELIEAGIGEKPSETNGRFLGFDLSNGGYSLICWGLPSAATPSQLSTPRDVLLDTTYRCFAPYINDHGLFDRFDTASFCLHSMDALQRLFPGTFEAAGSTLDLSEYAVRGIYLVNC